MVVFESTSDLLVDLSNAISFDKVKNLSTTFDKAEESDKPTNPTDDSNTTK